MIKLKYTDFYIFENIAESPIDNYTFLDKHSDSNSFSTSEKNLLKDPNHVKKVRDFFQNTKVNFNLYFVNFKNDELEDFKKDSRYGYISYDDLQKEFNINIPKPSPDSITFIFTSNWGTNLVKMTPWIIAHRISHGLTGGIKNAPHPSSSEANLNFNNILRVLHNDLESLIINGYETNPPNKQYLITNTYDVFSLINKQLFTFKSAREDNLSASGEIFHELFAQYILKGTIELNIPETFRILNTDFKITPQFEEQRKQTEQYLIRYINKRLKVVLHTGIGNIYII